MKHIKGGEKDNSLMHRYPTRFQAKNQVLIQRTLEIQKAAIAQQQKQAQQSVSSLSNYSETMRDVNVLNELLAKNASSMCRIGKMEAAIQLLEYLMTHPLLIRNHASICNVVGRKIAEFKEDIRLTRQNLKVTYVSRPMAEWREMAQVLGLMDVIEELSCRIQKYYM